MSERGQADDHLDRLREVAGREIERRRERSGVEEMPRVRRDEFSELGKELGEGLGGLVDGLQKSQTGKNVKRAVITGIIVWGVVVLSAIGGAIWLIKYGIDAFAG